jgi:hypothetical protein
MEISKFMQGLAVLENQLIMRNDIDGLYGDGKSLVNNEEFPIEHDFEDQLYMRKMKMKAGSVVISAIHETNHFWFLMTGKILVNTNGEIIEHIAPCYEHSAKGAKRVIHCLEDCIFINIHKNPSNEKDLNILEKQLYSFTIDEHLEKNK